jgi:hypothetical protein
MDLQHVIGLRFAPTEQDYEMRDSLLYALSLGMGSDPLDADELTYVYEGLASRPQHVVPSQCMILGWQPFWQNDPATGIAWKQILHGEEHFQIHRPLKAVGQVRTEHRLVNVHDKGPARGALLQMNTELFDRASGEHLASLQSLQFMRGDGGCGSWGEPAARVAPLTPIADDMRPLAAIEYRTSLQAALLYRAASRDWMPIHADPAVAQEAGFERPISHGLNNLGLACRAILKTCARGKPERMRSLAARFVAPGLPGDTVSIEIFEGEGATLRFRATAVERGARLLDRGTCALQG